MHISWQAVELFLAVAEAGSLSRAAKTLGVSQPTVSRGVADIEGELGEVLFTRSVAGVALTAAAGSGFPAAIGDSSWLGLRRRAACRSS